MTEKEVATESKNQEKNETDNIEEETSAPEAAIIRQMEYYFGDANMTRDKFLAAQVQLDEGWVPLEVMLTFNRLNKLTKDAEVIANALNNATSGLIEVSEDNKKVRRNPEMPVPEMNEDRRKELQGRTVYVKGFLKDAVLDDVMKFFKDHGDVESVIMRRFLEKQTKLRKFKGSVFATFKDKEQADKFVSSKGLKVGETDLIIRWQAEYLKEKQDEYLARKEKKEKKPKEGEAAPEKAGIELPTGTVLHFSEGSDKMTRENVKEALAPILEPLAAEIAFIDFKVGDKEGWVRMTKQDAAKEIMPKIDDGKLTIDEKPVTFRLLEGEEETLYLERTVEEMSKRRRNQKNNRQGRGNKGGYKGKQQHGRKRRQGNPDDAPPQKIRADAS